MMNKKRPYKINAESGGKNSEDRAETTDLVLAHYQKGGKCNDVEARKWLQGIEFHFHDGNEVASKGSQSI